MKRLFNRLLALKVQLLATATSPEVLNGLPKEPVRMFHVEQGAVLGSTASKLGESDG